MFALFGSVAPLFALLAQPHRGAREPLAATTAVDIAGLAVVTGFLYSFFVTAPTSTSLLIVSELQQGLVVCGMAAAMFAGAAHGLARHLSPPDARRGGELRHADDQQRRRRSGAYRTAFVYDFTWILPFAFFPWAATLAPASKEIDVADDEEDELVRPRPWVIFTAVALLPFLDYGLRRIAPDEAFSGFRDLSTAITIISGAAAARRAHRRRARRAPAGRRDDAAAGAGDRAGQGSDPGDDDRRPLPPRQRRILPRA